jgi:hypothetical protein
MVLATVCTAAAERSRAVCRWRNDYGWLEGALQAVLLLWRTIHAWVERRLGGQPAARAPGALGTITVEEVLGEGGGFDSADDLCMGDTCPSAAV